MICVLDLSHVPPLSNWSHCNTFCSARLVLFCLRIWAHCSSETPESSFYQVTLNEQTETLWAQMRLHRKTPATVVFLQLRLFILHAVFFGYDKTQHVPGSCCSFKHFRFIRVGARRQVASIHNYKLIQSLLLSLPWLIHAGDAEQRRSVTLKDNAPPPINVPVCVYVCV